MEAIKQKESQIVPLRNASQVTEAYEWLHAQQRAGTIDATRANGMNATLKGVTKLRVEIPMKLIELSIKAQKNKAELPTSFTKVVDQYADVLMGKNQPMLEAGSEPEPAPAPEPEQPEEGTE